MKEDLQRLGLIRFLTIVIGFTTWIVIGVWMAWTAPWPSGCVPEGGLTARVIRLGWCSPYLLDRTAAGYIFFVWIWSFLVPILSIIIFALFRLSKSRM